MKPVGKLYCELQKGNSLCKLKSIITYSSQQKQIKRESSVMQMVKFPVNCKSWGPFHEGKIKNKNKNKNV